MVVTQSYINPSAEQIAALRELDLEGPLVMVNLLRFLPDGGAEQYGRYAAATQPFLESSGATVRYLGGGAATVIGPDEWDSVILVEYPNVRSFLEMVGRPDYPSELRDAALADSRLYCTQEGQR
jgi:uncharacterized protein (DUF1330 family)